SLDSAFVARILVADPLAEDGLARLRREGEVTVATKLAEADLVKRIPDYDALIVRSETKVTAPILEAGKRLRVVGRAGVGVDNIDVAAAKRAHGLEMDVIAYDPVVAVERAELFNVELVPLDDLLQRADFVTIHVPLVEANRGLIAARELAMMKPAARLINTARGGIVDEAALYQALKGGRPAAAAFDVFEQEPPGENPLFTLPNFVATPHIAGSTAE